MIRVFRWHPALPFGIILMAGCTGLGRVPQQEHPTTHPKTPPAQAAAVKGASHTPAATHPDAPIPPGTPPALAIRGVAVASAPGASTSRAPSKPAAPPQPAPPVAQPAPSPMDLKLLETRLRETRAISVFSKLALQNQIEDLLERLRAYFQGRLQTSLAALRQSYDLLVMKTLALLQDGDPPLARAIALSRDSIWGILSDPAKLESR
jgi:hypothetical protein